MVRNKTPKFLNPNTTNDRGRRKQFKRHEKDLADRTGGVESHASGALGMKGDVHAEREMIEAKSTKNKSISLKLKWLEKLVKEAFEAGMNPVLALRFEAMKYGAKDWAVIPMDRYEELLEHELSGH